MQSLLLLSLRCGLVGIHLCGWLRLLCSRYEWRNVAKLTKWFLCSLCQSSIVPSYFSCRISSVMMMRRSHYLICFSILWDWQPLTRFCKIIGLVYFIVDFFFMLQPHFLLVYFFYFVWQKIFSLLSNLLEIFNKMFIEDIL